MSFFFFSSLLFAEFLVFLLCKILHLYDAVSIGAWISGWDLCLKFWNSGQKNTLEYHSCRKYFPILLTFQKGKLENGNDYKMEELIQRITWNHEKVNVEHSYFLQLTCKIKRPFLKFRIFFFFSCGQQILQYFLVTD